MTEKTARPTSCEEDYRDYEERDLNDGWPYADAVIGSETAVQNQSYGDTAQNFDESGNPGFETSADSAIHSAEGTDLLGERTHHEIDDDGIEEAISERLENSDLDTAGIDIKVSDGVVHLTGFVETAAHRHLMEKLINTVPGVVSIRDRLTLTAADANIPADWDA